MNNIEELKKIMMYGDYKRYENKQCKYCGCKELHIETICYLTDPGKYTDFITCKKNNHQYEEYR